MKKLFLLSLLFSAFIFQANASHGLELAFDEDEIIFTSSNMTCTLADKSQRNLLENVQYFENSGDVSFTMKENITFVQVFDSEGKLEYQLPIGTNELILQLDDLNTGKYQINFLLQESRSTVITTLEKK